LRFHSFTARDDAEKFRSVFFRQAGFGNYFFGRLKRLGGNLGCVVRRLCAKFAVFGTAARLGVGDAAQDDLLPLEVFADFGGGSQNPVESGGPFNKEIKGIARTDIFFPNRFVFQGVDQIHGAFILSL
jgi:hypothetical protein